MVQKQLKEQIVKAIEDTTDKDVIKSISVFGSYLHGDNKEDSDVDLIIDLAKPIGLFAFVGIKQHLEKELGRKVDLVTRDGLSRYIREKVTREAEKIYG